MGETTPSASDITTTEFSDAGDGNNEEQQMKQLRIAQDPKIDGEPGNPKEYRHEKRNDQTPQLFLNMLDQLRQSHGRIRDIPIFQPVDNFDETHLKT